MVEAVENAQTTAVETQPTQATEEEEKKMVIPDFSKLRPRPIAAEAQLREILPKAGLVYSEKALLSEALCKPKLLPLKSATLQKLEKMEQDLTQQQLAGHGIQTSASQAQLSGQPGGASGAGAGF